MIVFFALLIGKGIEPLFENMGVSHYMSGGTMDGSQVAIILGIIAGVVYWQICRFIADFF